MSVGTLPAETPHAAARSCEVIRVPAGNPARCTSIRVASPLRLVKASRIASILGTWALDSGVLGRGSMGRTARCRSEASLSRTIR